MTKGAKDRDEEIIRILRQYSKQSTIAGLHYAFEPQQSKIVNFLWLVAIIILTSAGTYVSIQNYIDWRNEPVMTTVTSTGLDKVLKHVLSFELQIITVYSQICVQRLPSGPQIYVRC